MDTTQSVHHNMDITQSVHHKYGYNSISAS